MARKATTIVLKFGGSSVANSECIERISKIAIRESKEHNVIVVTSAMGKTTNQLIDLANQVCPGCDGRELDMLLATGELVSISLAAMAIQKLGHPAVSLTGWQAGFVTESSHNKARIAEIKCDRINKHLELGEIVVVAGFQGITEDGEVTTLGRGGSDTSAVALASAFKADRCDIYTDVKGVYTTDPRVVKEATKLDHISFEEMIELASLGAKVLHPRSVELAKKYNIDLRVRSSFKPENKGTEVISLQRMKDMELTKAVTGVALDTKQAKIAIISVADRPGIASKVFGELGKNKINVDMIIQSVPRDGINDIAFTVPREDMETAKAVCEEILKDIEGSKVEADDGIAKVSIVGAGMLNRPGVASTLFETLSQAGINIQMISTSEIKISCLIDEADATKAVQVIHDAFELEKSSEPIIV
ncbi:MAG: aspartate kinase [Candidatus Melainabacteria bacterium]|nr:aspartate kinase [Candidatus Melainabacteria bacterium]